MINLQNRPFCASFFAVLFSLTLVGCNETIDARQLEKINGLFYKLNEHDPFTGTVTNNIKIVDAISNSRSNCTIEYKNGQIDGSTICYSLENNLKVSHLTYKNNLRNGTQTQWDDTQAGALKWKIDWKNDMKDGVEEHYNLATGKVVQQTHWKESRKIGEDKIWDGSGNVLLQDFDWQNGKKTGFIKVESIEANYKDGELHGIKREFSLNGQEESYNTACPPIFGFSQRIGLCSYTMYEHSIEREEMYENGNLVSRKIKGGLPPL